MSGMTEASACAAAIRPFTVPNICDAELEAPHDTGRGPWLAVSGQ